jgi:hypothetical protein
MVRLLAHIFTPTGAIRAWASVLMVVLGFGLALGLTIGYVVDQQHKADARWCALLGSLITPQPSTPPQSPQEVRGRQVTEQIRTLYRQLGCR